MELLSFQSDAAFDKYPNSKMLTYEQNSIIQTPDLNKEGLYYIKKGKVRFYKINADGKKFTYCILGEHNYFGDVDFFSTGTRDFFIDCLEETTVCFVEKKQLQILIQNNPALSLSLLAFLSKHLEERNSLLEILAFSDLQSRIIFSLHKLSEQFGSHEGIFCKINVPLSHQEIADMVAASREAVSVILKKLSAMEIIKTTRKTIHIHKAKVKELMM